MRKGKTWEELTLSDDFIFAKVMLNQELCKELLEKILNIKISKIEYPEEQKSINVERDARSVRLDVYVQDESQTVYNIEMQATDTKELPLRSRYYQGMIDLNIIEKGQSYKKLPRSYIIFICTFDMFGKSRWCYTFKNICIEEPDLELQDETIKIFLNTKGISEDIDEDIKGFFSCIEGKSTDNEFGQKMQKEVHRVKEHKEWRREYMTLFMRDQENYEKGLAEGIEQGIEQGIERGICALIHTCHMFQVTREVTAGRLKDEYGLTSEEIENVMEKYWEN